MTTRLRMRSWASAANGLTLLRVLLIVPLLIALGNGWMAGAMVLMAIAAATDVADGMVARRIGTATRLGAVLDPAADAILVFAVQAQLVAAGRVAAVVGFDPERRFCCSLRFGPHPAGLREVERASTLGR